jgi:hypothetical protein
LLLGQDIMGTTTKMMWTPYCSEHNGEDGIT